MINTMFYNILLPTLMFMVKVTSSNIQAQKSKRLVETHCNSVLGDAHRCVLVVVGLEIALTGPSLLKVSKLPTVHRR